MATLIFTALGTAFGGPLGGAIGALVGRTIDGAIIGSPSREGPRLKELSVTTSTYGSAIGRHFGQMRVPGSIIWATDLVEHRETSGGGKGRPSVTSYSYSASFAVALGSRPLSRIGRIWADGNLLRGSSGDLKAGGQFRFYAGTGDQAADALLVAAEAAGLCPGYRGTAYAVFQDLQLADFGNRIPALTFEVFADESAFNLATLVDGVLENVDADVPLAGIAGISCEGPISELLAQIVPAIPLDFDVSGDVLALRSPDGAASALREATITSSDDGFGGAAGFARKRLPSSENPPELIRYYDITRDYQPGMQRILGRPAPGQPTSIELPVATDAATARSLIETAAQRATWARQTISWRTAEIAPEVRPGSLVTVPGQPGVWRVTEWEWRASGVELTLWRIPPTATGLTSIPASDPGRPLTANDTPLGETELVAFELPWDGSGMGDTPQVFAATSSASAGWTGAALYVQRSDGQLEPCGTSGRTRATLGRATSVLAAASPHLFDRRSTVTVQLIAPDATLLDATGAQLAAGANRALLGSEIIQFVRAVPLGAGEWRLEGLLRGRGGTESAIPGHAVDETFVLLDSAPTPLDGALFATGQISAVTAIGLGDVDPVSSPVRCAGVTRRPLSPVHPRAAIDAAGNLALGWTRRARGALAWLDGVDTPLHEESESYDVLLGPADLPQVVWTVASPSLTLSAAEFSTLRATYPGAALSVRQRGSYAVSEALLLTHLA